MTGRWRDALPPVEEPDLRRALRLVAWLLSHQGLGGAARRAGLVTAGAHVRAARLQAAHPFPRRPDYAALTDEQLLWMAAGRITQAARYPATAAGVALRAAEAALRTVWRRQMADDQARAVGS